MQIQMHNIEYHYLFTVHLIALYYLYNFRQNHSSVIENGYPSLFHVMLAYMFRCIHTCMPELSIAGCFCSEAWFGWVPLAEVFNGRSAPPAAIHTPYMFG